MAVDQIERVFTIKADGTSAIKQLEKISKSSQQTAAGVANLSKGFSKLENIVKGGIGLVVIRKALNSIIDATKKFQDLKISLEVVTGSVQSAQREFRKLGNFVGKTPFSLEEMTNAFVKLKTSGLEPTEKRLLLFSDVASATAEKLKTFEAVVDLFAKASAGRLRLYDLDRLANAGLPVFDILNKKLGIARTGINDFVKGAGGAERVLKALEEGLSERFAGASSKALKTLSSAMGSLETQWLLLIDKFGDSSGFTDVLVKGVEGATDKLLKLSQTIDSFNETKIAIGISKETEDSIEIFTKIYTFLDNLGTTILKTNPLFKQWFRIWDDGKQLGQDLAKGMSLIGLYVQLTNEKFKLLYNFLKDKITPIFETITSGAKSLSDRLSAFLSPVSKLFSDFADKVKDKVTIDVEAIGLDKATNGVKNALNKIEDITSNKKTAFLETEIERLSAFEVKLKEVKEEVDNAPKEDPKLKEYTQKIQDAQTLTKSFASLDISKQLEQKAEKLQKIVDAYLIYNNELNETQRESFRANIEQFEISQDAATKALAETRKEQEKLKDASVKFAEEFKEKVNAGVVSGIGQMSDAFVEFAITGKEAFKDLTASILKDIAKIIVRATIMNALTSAFPSLAPGTKAGPATVGVSGGGTPTPKGGPVSTFSNPSTFNSILTDSGFNSALKSISGNAGGSNTTVNIINKTNGEASVQQNRNADGSTNITVMIEEKIKETISTGRLDELMAGNFGLSRRGY